MICPCKSFRNTDFCIGAPLKLPSEQFIIPLFDIVNFLLLCSSPEKSTGRNPVTGYFIRSLIGQQFAHIRFVAIKKQDILSGIKEHVDIEYGSGFRIEGGTR